MDTHATPTDGPTPVPAAAFNPFAVDDEDTTPAATPAPAPASPAVPDPQPAPAPTAEQAPATGPAPQADPEAGPDPAAQRAAAIARFAARRHRYAKAATVAAVAAAVVGAWVLQPWSVLVNPATVSAAGVHRTSQDARPASQVIAADMATVHARLAGTGDLTGLKLPGADVAAAGRSLYATRTVGGQCVIYGVADGRDIVPAADATGQACAGQIKTVQAQLDAADAARRAQAVTAATDALTKAAQAAGFYASQNFSGGQPSLTGLPTAALAGVTVTANHGTWAQLRATAAGTCRTAIVAATGELGETSPC